jgi:TrpR family trp operon transcriptional repressor
MKKSFNELCSIIAGLDTKKEVELVLTAFLTPKELDQVSERWSIIKGLNEGQSQREIAKRLGTGVMTVTRGSAALKNDKGGFKLALKRGAYLPK